LVLDLAREPVVMVSGSALEGPERQDGVPHPREGGEDEHRPDDGAIS
jgi:hypothetical protein